MARVYCPWPRRRPVLLVCSRCQADFQADSADTAVCPRCSALTTAPEDDTGRTGPWRGAVEGARPAPDVPGYEVLGELGRGGMGVVYKARQVKADRIVALKMVLAGAHAEEAERRRFRTEAEAGARLAHANI